MSTLRESLQDARIPNFEAKLFVPQSAVRRIMTPDRVRDQVYASDIPRQYADDIVEKILSGGQNVFAVLVLIKEEAAIKNFIEEDNLQGLELDRGLPFEELSLRRRLRSNECIHDFEITQWQLAVPHFTGDILPRNLADKVILPIIRNKPCGEGSFGDVYNIEIEGSHQFLGEISCQFVRKQFKESDVDDSVKKEIFNLCMLRLLKHPCLVELLGSYVQLGKWNLLFRHASGGSLEDCFNRERTTFFQDPQKLLYALYGLTSALSAVHTYFSQPHELRAVGCHHDLKPGNVLVENESFLLADFGLSKLDIDAKRSSTIPKGVRNIHAAPECKGLGRRVDQGISGTTVVHRSSDIWSLGCIMAEVFTYMIWGPDGRNAFEASRLNKIGKISHKRFYLGSGEPHPKVEQWFVKMEKNLDLEGIAILPLIRQMLVIEPISRPSVSTVLNHMRHISLQSICLKIEILMDGLQNHDSSIDLYIERRRFMGWKMSCNVGSSYESGTAAPHTVDLLSSCFQDIWTTLIDIRELITEMRSGENFVSEVHCRSLKRLNDCLLAYLPAEIRKTADPYLISSLLRQSDQDILDALATSSDSASGLAAVRVALQRLSARDLHGDPKRPDLQIDPAHIRDRRTYKGFELGRLTDTCNRTLFDVLIEKKKLPEDLSQNTRSVELLLRLELVTEVLEKAANNGFRMLRCCGYFIDSRETVVERGLIYKQPTFKDCSEELEAATLNSVILACRRNPKPTAFPTLDAKFRLARSLAQSILDFHQAEWLQEGISSHSILFFFPQGSTWLQDEETQRPYFLGFLNSRQATLSALTEGPDRKPHQEYSHPDYATGVNERFKPSFDYYSLGIVLLEIGRWKTLSAMVDIPKVRNGLQEVQKQLQERELVYLKISMGKIYHDVVKLCLSGELGQHDTGDIGQSTMRFAEVVESLGRCFV